MRINAVVKGALNKNQQLLSADRIVLLKKSINKCFLMEQQSLSLNAMHAHFMTPTLPVARCNRAIIS